MSGTIVCDVKPTQAVQREYSLPVEDWLAAIEQHRNEVAAMVGVSPSQKAQRYADDMPVHLGNMLDPLYFCTGAHRDD